MEVRWRDVTMVSNAAANKDAFHATFFIFDASSFLAHPPFVSHNYAFH